MSKPHRDGITKGLIARLKDLRLTNYTGVLEILAQLAMLDHSTIARTLHTIEYLLSVLLAKSIDDKLADRYSLSVDLAEFSNQTILELSHRFFALALRIIKPVEVIKMVPGTFLDFVESVFAIHLDSPQQNSIVLEFQTFCVDSLLQLIDPISNGPHQYQFRLRVTIVKLLGWLGFSTALNTKIFLCVSLSLQVGLFEEEQFPDLLDLVVDNCKLHPLCVDRSLTQMKLHSMDTSFQSISSLIQ
jgi:hypothetical protein